MHSGASWPRLCSSLPAGRFHSPPPPSDPAINNPSPGSSVSPPPPDSHALLPGLSPRGSGSHSRWQPGVTPGRRGGRVVRGSPRVALTGLRAYVLPPDSPSAGFTCFQKGYRELARAVEHSFRFETPARALTVGPLHERPSREHPCLQKDPLSELESMCMEYQKVLGGWGRRPNPLYPWEPHKVSHRPVGTQRSVSWNQIWSCLNGCWLLWKVVVSTCQV